MEDIIWLIGIMLAAMWVFAFIYLAVRSAVYHALKDFDEYKNDERENEDERIDFDV